MWQQTLGTKQNARRRPAQRLLDSNHGATASRRFERFNDGDKRASQSVFKIADRTVHAGALSGTVGFGRIRQGDQRVISAASGKISKKSGRRGRFRHLCQLRRLY